MTLLGQYPALVWDNFSGQWELIAASAVAAVLLFVLFWWWTPGAFTADGQPLTLRNRLDELRSSKRSQSYAAGMFLLVWPTLGLLASAVQASGSSGGWQEEYFSPYMESGLVKSDHRASAPPDAEGEYWFYSFFSDPSNGDDLILCKERVRVYPSENPLYDYQYKTLDSSLTSCGRDYAAWRGFLVWWAPRHAFVDIAYDPKNDEFLIGYLKVPAGTHSLSEIDSTGFQAGPADYGEEPVSNLYLLSIHNYSAGAALEAMRRNSSHRLALLNPSLVGRSRVECDISTFSYDGRKVTEINTCAGEAPLPVYSEIRGR